MGGGGDIDPSSSPPCPCTVRLEPAGNWDAGECWLCIAAWAAILEAESVASDNEAVGSDGSKNPWEWCLERLCRSSGATRPDALRLEGSWCGMGEKLPGSRPAEAPDSILEFVLLLREGGVRSAERGEEVEVRGGKAEMAVAFEITDEASLPEEPGRSRSRSRLRWKSSMPSRECRGPGRGGGSGDREVERSGETVTGERSISVNGLVVVCG
ncbi:uncharacterized protein BDV14DRAFT_182001 [Aspergillus stella-maris]|uniref:uncharacterized protein n=1 Tax=Aspergillus stella-maris TaxID=1810926 RepID=UPI003CCDBFB5